MAVFFDRNINEVQTELMLTMRGLPLDPAVLAQAGIVPIEYPEPAYNPDTHAIEPDGDPKPKDDGTAYVQGFVVVERPMPEAGAAVKARITAKRWEKETGGLTLPDGTKVNTGIDDQNRIASALQGMERAGMTEVDFKGVDGWTKLSAEQLSGVAAAIAAHVQACFSHERALHELVDVAESIADLQSVDINAGWPGMDTVKA